MQSASHVTHDARVRRHRGAIAGLPARRVAALSRSTPDWPARNPPARRTGTRLAAVLVLYLLAVAGGAVVGGAAQLERVVQVLAPQAMPAIGRGLRSGDAPSPGRRSAAASTAAAGSAVATAGPFATARSSPAYDGDHRDALPP